MDLLLLLNNNNILELRLSKEGVLERSGEMDVSK